MADEKQVRRRRRPPQAIPQIPEEDEEPHRIVVGAQDEEPDWLVSAGKVSGAASRRTRQTQSAQSTRHSAEETKAPTEKKTAAKKAYTVKKASQNARTTEQNAQTPEAPAKPPQAERVVRSAPKKPAAAKPAAKKPRKPGKKGRNTRVRRVMFGALSCALFILLLTVGIIGGGRLMDIKRTLDKGDNVFYPNIYVNDIPLEGYTLDEAADIVTRQVTSLISSWKITLRTQDGRSWDITGEDVKMQYDVADQLDQLWAIGHTGSSSARYEQVKALEEEPVMRYTTLTYDLSNVNQILTQIKAEVDQPAVSATRVDDDTKWPPFSYTDDVPGQELDITGLNEQICAMVDKLESGVVDLTPTSVEALVTREQLEGQIVLLSTYETAVSSTSVPGRFINIEVATNRFNELIIKPGESVSFNKVAGKRTYANGYADAPELARGEYVTGVGGGVCQVSSTLYNAVVNAGLTVTNRVAHSIASSYVPKGLDATVSDDRLDFVFKNSTSADIYISTQYYKKKGYYYCQFTIHGRPDPNGYTYKLESEVTQVIEKPDPIYEPDTTGEYVIYDDEEPYRTSKGEEGYVVDVYKVTMDANGLQVSRDYLYTDTYKARADRYKVGVTPRPTPESDGLYY